MTTEKLFHELLGLKMSWEVTECRYEPGAVSKVLLRIQETPVVWEFQSCPKCQGEVKGYDHTELLRWRHLNIFEHECEIECRLPRGRCAQCAHTYRVRPPWEGLCSHFTKAFEAFALLLMREMSVAKAAQTLNETDQRLRRMMEKHVDRAYAEADFSQVTQVGVDELCWRSGREYLSLFADMAKKRVLFGVEGRDAQTVEAFAQALEAHQGHRHAIREVSMDMSPAFQAGVKNHCRNAEIVFDKFHVMAQVNHAIDLVRRTEQRRGEAEAKKQLSRTLWLWRKNPENRSEKEQARMNRIDQQHVVTAKAYQMKLSLQDLYRMENRGMAKRRLRAWVRWVRGAAKRQAHGILWAMQKVADMMERHEVGILAYWDNHTTNAWMEALNTMIQMIKRRARGYRSSANLIRMIYFMAAQLRLPAF